MHPVLIEIPSEAAAILGWAVAALGGIALLYNAARWARAPTAERKRWLAGMAWSVLFVAGGLATALLVTFTLPLYSYGVLLGISFVLGWILTLRWAARAGVPPEVSRTCLFLVIVGAIVGARLLFVLTNLDRFQGRWSEVFALRQGGLVAYGGMIGGTLAAYVYLRLKRVNFWAFADAASPSIALGLALTRVGCFLYGCDYGKPAGDLALAVRFPGASLERCSGAPAFEHHCRCLTGTAPETADCSGIVGSLTDGGALASLPVHPTQLYESAVGVALFGVLYASMRLKRFHGQTFLLLVLFYAVARYLLEMVRDDLQRGSIWIFTTSQLIGVVLVPLGLGLAVYLAKKQRIVADEAG
jgi:phosphatidylglycerol:prolipoprotein diacylglycerol transferase